MSLINRMLQDLDKRSADGAAAHAVHSQVRVVPPGKRLHPAWWAVPLAVSLSLGIIYAAWRSQQKTPVVDIALNVADLLSPSLKLSPSLSMVQSLTQAPPPIPMDQNPMAQAPAVSAEKIASLPMPAGPKPLPEKQIKENVQVAAPAATDPVLAKTAPVPAIGHQVKEVNAQQRAENEYRKAIASQQQGRAADAISALEQTLQIDPLHIAARQTLVGLLLEAKRQDEAMRRLKEGLSVDPAQSGMAMILARLQVDKGEARAAVETLQRSLPHAADRADYLAFLAALLQREGRHIEAAEYYSMALQKAPQNAIWWMGLGISQQAENRLPLAQEAFARAKASNTLPAELQAFVEQRLNQLAGVAK